jgi:hypothetical protein
MNSLEGYYGMMFGAYRAMPEEEKETLHAWEREHVDGSGRFTTSDWPGWGKYIGSHPSKDTSPAADRKECGGFIYLVRAHTGEHKIGHSVNPGSRIKTFSVQPPFEYKLIHTFFADDMKRAEVALHEKFSNKRIKGEWFLLNSNDIDLIQSIIGFQNGRFNPDI